MSSLELYLLRSFSVLTLIVGSKASAQDTLSLGIGVDLQSGFVREKCINGDLSTSGGGEAFLDATHQKNLLQEQQSLGGNILSQINLGVLGSKKSTEYLSRIAANDVRESFEIGLTLRLPTQVLLNPKLDSALVANLPYMTPESQRKRCGTGAIVSIIPGIRFRAALVLDFKNKEAHARFKEVVKTRVLWNTRTKIFLNEIKKSQSEFHAHIELIQEGGSQTALAGLRSSMSSCEPAKVEECLGVFEKVLTYLNSPDAVQGLQQQFNQAKLGTDPANLPSILEYNVIPYNDMYLPGFKAHTGKDLLAQKAGSLTQEMILQNADAHRAKLRLELMREKKIPTSLSAGSIENFLLKIEEATDSLYRATTSCKTVFASSDCVAVAGQTKQQVEALLAPIKAEIDR